ncbi:MAG: glycine cleavage system protein [Thermoproteota archaeon]|nr:glycine cleavage system protein [Thermoproteota archaeon]
MNFVRLKRELKIENYDIPDNLFYSKEHEWALLEKPNFVKIGITDYAQKALHDIVFVDIPKKGTIVEMMKSVGTVESVKSVSEVFSPVSGSIADVNEELRLNPELINEDPYGKGWIALIETNNFPEESKKLLTPIQYVGYLRTLSK